jgi:hypothetical protein
MQGATSSLLITTIWYDTDCYTTQPLHDTFQSPDDKDAARTAGTSSRRTSVRNGSCTKSNGSVFGGGFVLLYIQKLQYWIWLQQEVHVIRCPGRVVPLSLRNPTRC